ncbi:MAG: ankyrin repeat domain-containing protein [Rickettsiaceae bacterium]|nr:ankyrin repeat domain-containing protein [Rickettsiaceae bacterium]
MADRLTPDELKELNEAFNFFFTDDMLTERAWRGNFNLYEFTSQSKLLEQLNKYLPDEYKLTYDGLCCGLTLEFTRYLIKHQNDPDPVGDFCKKIDTELNQLLNPKNTKTRKNPENFLRRLVGYQVFQLSAKAGYFDQKKHDLSNDIPDYISEMEEKLYLEGHIGIGMVGDKGGHRISLHKIKGDLILFDPNRGMAKFSGDDTINRCNRIIYLLHKENGYTKTEYSNYKKIYEKNFMYKEEPEGNLTPEDIKLRKKEKKYVPEKDDLDNKLLYATILNKKDYIKKILSQGANPNTLDFYGYSAIDYAIDRSYVDQVRELIYKGSEISQRALDIMKQITDEKKKEEIQGLVNKAKTIREFFNNLAFGTPESISKFIAENKDILNSLRDKNGNTPLIVAINNGKNQNIKALLAEGAEANHSYSSTETPLSIAITKGNIEGAKMLINYGADLDHSAVKEALDNSTKLSSDAKLTLKESKKKGSELVKIIQDGDLERLKTFMKKNAEFDLNFRDEFGISLMFHAVYNGRKEIVSYLIQNKVSVNQVLNGRETALMTAASKGDIEMLEMLLDNGSEINYRVEDGSTPLTLAIKSGNVDAVKMLLRGGAKFTGRDLKMGANISIAINELGEVDTIYKNKMVKLFTAMEAIEMTEFVGIIKSKGCNENLEQFLKKHDDIDLNSIKGHDGQGVIEMSLESRDPKIIETLIKRGANVNEKGLNNRTPLIKALCINCLEIAKILIQNGANVNEKDSFGKSAIDYAIETGKKEMIEILLKNGATLDATKEILLENGATPDATKHKSLDIRTSFSKLVSEQMPANPPPVPPRRQSITKTR